MHVKVTRLNSFDIMAENASPIGFIQKIHLKKSCAS